MPVIDALRRIRLIKVQQSAFSASLHQVTSHEQGLPRRQIGSRRHSQGRHDVCAVPRAIPIVEALTLLVLADACLHHQLNKHD